MDTSEPHHGTREGVHLVIMPTVGEGFYFIQEGANPGATQKAYVPHLCLATDRASTFQLRAGRPLTTNRVLGQDPGHVVVYRVYARCAGFLFNDYLC